MTSENAGTNAFISLKPEGYTPRQIYKVMTGIVVPRPVALALYRIVQESLRNVARHSGATTASVVLAGEDGPRLSLFIIDNGKGFDPGLAKINPGLGLVSIEERARHIGATVSIDSMPDAGTRLGVLVPLIQ